MSGDTYSEITCATGILLFLALIVESKTGAWVIFWSAILSSLSVESAYRSVKPVEPGIRFEEIRKSKEFRSANPFKNVTSFTINFSNGDSQTTVVKGRKLKLSIEGAGN